MDRACDQRDVRTHFCRGLCNCKTLPARGTVGDIAHRIYRLMRRASGHQNMITEKRAVRRLGKIGLGGHHGRRGRQMMTDFGKDTLDFGQAARAEFAAGHFARIRIHHMHAISAQARNVAPRRRMLPHTDVHCRNS